MSVWIEPIYHDSDAARVRALKASGKRIPSTIEPRAWDVRWRENGGRSDRRKRYVTEIAAKNAAQRKQEELERRRNAYALPPELRGVSSAIKLSEFAPLYVRLYLNPETAPGTPRSVESLLDRIIIADLGGKRLCDLTPLSLAMWAFETLPATARPVWAPKDKRRVGEAFKSGTPRPKTKAEASRLHQRGQLPLPIGWEPAAPSQCEHAVIYLKSMLARAVEWRILDANPADELRTKSMRTAAGKRRSSRDRKQRREDELADLATVAVDVDDGRRELANPPVPLIEIERVRLFLSPRDAAFVAWLYGVGTRPSEGTRLIWDWIRDRESGEINRTTRIFRAISGRVDWGTKTTKSRTVTIFDPVRDAMFEWYWQLTEILGHEPSPFSPVFPILSKAGRHPYLSATLWSAKTLAAGCRRAGVEPFNAYRLRSTCCALLAAGGDESAPGTPWPIAEVAKQLGHSVQTCERYYYATLPDPGRYRGIPIERHMRDFAAEARAELGSVREEIVELARYASAPEIRDLLNEQGVRPWHARNRYSTHVTTHEVRQVIRQSTVRDELEEEARAADELIRTHMHDTRPEEIAALLSGKGIRTRRRTIYTKAAVVQHILRLGHKPVP